MRADARAAVLLAGTQTMLAGECPLFSAWGRFEDGAPAPRDRLLRKGLVLLVLAHTEKALRDTGEPFLLLICGWSDGLRTMLAAQFRTTGTRTMLAGECPLCGAERLEDGAPATHVHGAVYVCPLRR